MLWQWLSRTVVSYKYSHKAGDPGLLFQKHLIKLPPVMIWKGYQVPTKPVVLEKDVGKRWKVRICCFPLAACTNIKKMN
jgi:hypothetical protein